MRYILLVLLLHLLGCLMAPEVTAQPTRPWNCGDENIIGLQKKHDQNYALSQQRSELQIRHYIRSALRQKNSNISPRGTSTERDSTYTIPVVIHVLHPPGEAYGTGNNISYAQILSQIEALNAAFGKSYPTYNNQSHPDYAQDTRIRFCLARNTAPQTESWAVGPGGIEYGVKRYPDNTTAYQHNMTVQSSNRLKSITHPKADYFPFGKYLNIWLVKTIDGADNVMGYAPKPLTGEYPIDGVVMRSDIFGDNTTGGRHSLKFYLTQGKILAHEIGHYLNLYHIFQGGCAGTNAAGSPIDACDLNGDYICDTKPATTQNVACNSGSYNTCSANYETGTTDEDMLNNYMSYADDDCMNTFTKNQAERMWASLEVLRRNLWQPANLAATGVLGNDGCVPSYLNATIEVNTQVYCAERPIRFSNPVAGNTAVSREWQFPGALPSASTSDSITVMFTVPGNYKAILTVKDATTTRKDSITFTIVTCKLDSTKQNMAHWYFGEYCSLDFSAGTPVKTTTALDNQSIHSESAYPGQLPFVAATVSVSDASGKLLFYSNGVSVWNNNHKKMNTAPVFGASDINASSGFYHIPFPGQEGKYFIAGVFPNFDEKPSGVRFALVDVAANTVSPYQEFSHPSLPKRFSQYLTVVPHCNGTDYWIITKGHGSDFNNDCYAFLVTASGIDAAQEPVISSGFSQPAYNGTGYQLKADYTGTKLMLTSPSASAAAALYDFNTRTGTIKNERLVPNVSGYNNIQSGVAFSPNGQYFYLMRSSDLQLNGPPYWLFQYRVSDFAYNIIATTGFYFSSVFQLGPDNQLYIANSYNYLARLADPDNWGGATFNGEFISFAEPSFMMKQYSSLPTFIDARFNEPTQPDFTIKATDCDSYLFSTLCYDKYEADWDFGDGSPLGKGSSVSHTYSSSGDYNVTLSISRGTKQYGTITKKVTVLSKDIDITGPDSVCSINNFATQYFAKTAFNADYKWSVVNGTISGPDNLTYAGVNWKNGTTDSAIIRLDISTGDVCKLTATKKVMLGQPPILTWPLQDNICITDSALVLNATPEGGVFSGTGVNGNIFDPGAVTPGTHELIYRYKTEFCPGEIQKPINVVTNCNTTPPTTAQQGLGMPNAFTPNGDGLNDVFRIPKGLLSTLQEFSVYNRWGEKLFSTLNLQTGWNGIMKNLPAPPGAYIYFISGTGQNGKTIIFRGTVLLMR